MWNPEQGDEAPQNFLAALYGEEDDDEDDDEEEQVEFVDDEMESRSEGGEASPTPPPYSPLTIRGSSPLYLFEEPGIAPRARSISRSPEPYYEELTFAPRVRSRTRSRSPLPQPESNGVVLAIFDSAGVELETPAMDVEEFHVPDSHALYESRESSSVVVERGGRGRASGRRGGRRGGGRGRSRGQRQVRGRGGGRGRRQAATTWEVGQPLEQVWLTDDDVSPELRDMVRDVIRRRQERLEEVRVRNERRRNSEVRNEGENSEGEHDDVFEDASDGRGNPLLEGVDSHFEWCPMDTFRSVEETFVPERTGAVSSFTSPYDAFRSYWDDDILQTIVDETNRYASRIQSAAFQSYWYETNAHEVLCLFAFWMMTGIIRMPTIFSYFSNNALLHTNVFSRITTLKRYTHLCRALHFVDTSESANPTNAGAASFDRLHRLQPIIDHLNNRFQSNYVLSKDICIDESLTLWKGRLQFKQYIQSKAAKFGIKTFELCESATGYLWSFLVYTGKETRVDTGLAKSTATVLKLIEPLLNKGYRLFMDNWFNSPLLARCLKQRRTDCVGTLRPSRVDVPRIVTQAPLKQGQLVARHSGDVCVLSWMDKKRVNMISTCHGAAIGLPNVSSRPQSRPEPYKPQSVLDYNRFMGGVDLKDQMLEPYLLERKRCAKWYLKLFKRLLNVSIHNSRVLVESSLKARQDNLTFRLELVDSILTHHHPHIPLSRRYATTSRRSASFPQIVRQPHWPVRVPQTPADAAAPRSSRGKCAVCSREGRKLQKSPFMCEECKVPLCVVGCFKKYHTSL